MVATLGHAVACGEEEGGVVSSFMKMSCHFSQVLVAKAGAGAGLKGFLDDRKELISRALETSTTHSSRGCEYPRATMQVVYTAL